MSFSLLSTLYTVTVFSLFAATLYRGSLHQKIALAFIALIVGYQAHEYQNRKLFIAVKNGEILKAGQALRWGARVNARNTLGETPLMIAIGLGHNDLALDLITKGADVHASSFEHHTPLHYAVANGNYLLAERLLTAGAHIDSQDLSGYTPLHYAVTYNDVALMNLLVTKGANLSLKNKKGMTSASLADKKFTQSPSKNLFHS